MKNTDYEVLIKLGFSPANTGYHYLSAVLEEMEKNDRERKPTSIIAAYASVSKSFKTKPENVDRNIRYAYEQVYKNADGEQRKLLETICGSSERQTNKQFASKLYEYLKYVKDVKGGRQG